jgi:hypothetical protein
MVFPKMKYSAIMELHTCYDNLKCKLKVSCAHVVKKYSGTGTILTVALEAGNWSSSRPGHFNSKEKALSTC